MGRFFLMFLVLVLLAGTAVSPVLSVAQPPIGDPTYSDPSQSRINAPPNITLEAPVAQPKGRTETVPSGSSLVPCGIDKDDDGVVKGPGEECTFGDLVTGVGRVIDFLIVLGTALSAVAFAYVGFLYLTAGGDTGKVKQAHGIFTTVLTGFIIMLSAWLVVKILETALLSREQRERSFLEE